MDNNLVIGLLGIGALFPALLGLLTCLSLFAPISRTGTNHNKPALVLGLLILPLFYLVGLIVVFILAFPLKPPADTSNRFNRLRLWWFATSAPHRFDTHYDGYWNKPTIILRLKILWDVFSKPQQFVDVYPWMKGDEVDNMGRFWTRKEK